MKKGVQVFISYRRDGGRDIARNIYERLSMSGYTTFFDYDSVQNGKFNIQIFKAIEQASDFILVLSKGALDHCVNMDDWVRIEIEYAIKEKKNIVLVAPEEFSGFPDYLPIEIASIKNIDIIFLYYKNKHYDQSINDIKSALIAKPSMFVKSKWIMPIVFVLLIMLFLYYYPNSFSPIKSVYNKMNTIDTTKLKKWELTSFKKRSNKKLEGHEIFERCASAVFMVFTNDGKNQYQGSGFFIDEDGLAVSNYHIFKGTEKGLERIKLLESEELYKITEVIKISEEENFILFRINCSNTNFLPIAHSKPKIGEQVFAIGCPQGLECTLSSGEVSQLRESNLIQNNALIDHGSSGGALINEYGEVVGITTGSFADGSQANLNYAFSIDVIKPYLK